MFHNIRTALSNFPFDRRGSIAIQFGLLIVPVMLLSGAAIDLASAYMTEERLQAASDAAAIAAASLPDSTSQPDRISKATNVFGANAGAANQGVTPQITVSGRSVSVQASKTINTNFLRLAHINSLYVASTSTASPAVSTSTAATGRICLLGLDPTSTDGIHIQGANVVSYPGCWGYTNSTQDTAINANGARATATGVGHCAVGKVSAPANNFSPTPTAGCPAVSDPFAKISYYAVSGVYTPTFSKPQISDTCTATNLNMKKGSYALAPGRYCGGFSLQAQATVTLSPGIYIIDNGVLNVQSGSSLSGSNVLFYFSGGGASMTIIGGGTINLKGRSASSSYPSFLFIADTANVGGISNIQGGGTLNLEGVLYMPTQTILVSGNGDVNGSSAYFGMVAKNFNFQGNGKFNLTVTNAATTLTNIMPSVSVVNTVALK